MGTQHSPKLQHYWNLTMKLLSVISRILTWVGLTLLPRSSRCILQPQPTGQHIIVYELLVLDRNTWQHITMCKLFISRTVTWSYNCLLRITSYLKPYNCLPIIGVSKKYLKPYDCWWIIGWFLWFLCLWHIKLYGLFNAKSILLEEQWWHDLIYNLRDKGVHIFPEGIRLKVNVIVWLEFELAYYDSTYQCFNHYTTRTPPVNNWC